MSSYDATGLPSLDDLEPLPPETPEEAAASLRRYCDACSGEWTPPAQDAAVLRAVLGID